MSINFFMRVYVALLALILTTVVALNGAPRYGECAVAGLALLYLLLERREELRALARAEAEVAAFVEQETRAAGRR